MRLECVLGLQTPSQQSLGFHLAQTLASRTMYFWSCWMPCQLVCHGRAVLRNSIRTVDGLATLTHYQSSISGCFYIYDKSG
jgi:hypothetical protein